MEGKALSTQVGTHILVKWLAKANPFEFNFGHDGQDILERALTTAKDLEFSALDIDFDEIDGANVGISRKVVQADGV